MGIAIFRHGVRGWRRAAPLLPIAMYVAVVLTVNHFFLDGIVGSAIVAVALALAERLSRNAEAAEPIAGRVSAQASATTDPASKPFTNHWEGLRHNHRVNGHWNGTCTEPEDVGAPTPPDHPPREVAASPMVIALPRIARAIPRPLRSLWALVVRHGLVLWLTLLTILAAAFVLREREQVAQIAGILRDADGRWVAVAVGIEIGLVVLTGFAYQALLRRLGHRIGVPVLAIVHLRRVLVGTVTPLGGPASLYVLVRSLARRGVRTEDTLLCAALRSLTGYAAFLVLLLPAIVFSHPTRTIVAGAIGLCVAFIIGIGALAWLLRAADGPRPWEHRVPRRLTAPIERIRGHGLTAADLQRPFTLALAIRLSGAAMLYVCLRAVGQTPDVSVALIAYVVGLLFLLIAPVFGGIGVVEVATAVALERLGVPAAPALAAALLCRLTELWLPLGLGLIAQLVETRRARGAHAGDTPQAGHTARPIPPGIGHGVAQPPRRQTPRVAGEPS